MAITHRRLARGDHVFIPIVTPRYFRSAECRRELLIFAGEAESLGVRELLLPMLYVQVPNLSPDSGDEAVALVAKTQYVDWTILRLESEDSAIYRQAVSSLAARLQEIALAFETHEPDSQPAVAPTNIDEYDDELGILDSAALGEEVATAWRQTLLDLTDAMSEMQPIIESASAEMNSAQSTNGKLIAARIFATSIDDAANRFRAKSNEYFTNIQEMDPALLRIIRGAQEAIAEGEDTSDFAELFASILQTVVTAVVITKNAIELAAILRTVSRTTRLIRPQLGAIAAGLRKIEDGQSLMSEWDRRIMDLGLIETSLDPSC